MNKVLVAGVLVPGLLAVGGCGHTDREARPHAARTTYATQITGRDWEPVTGALPSSDVPEPLAGPPTFAAVREAAHAGPTRRDAEQYALVVAQLVTDVRPGFSGERVIRLVEAPELDAIDREYVVEDLDSQRELGWQRHFDLSADMWIRSRPDVPTGEPSRVAVEVQGYSSLPGRTRGRWIDLRLDVVRHGDVWQLAAITQGSTSLTGERHLTPERNKVALPGRGWRRIPPAG